MARKERNLHFFLMKLCQGYCTVPIQYRGCEPFLSSLSQPVPSTAKNNRIIAPADVKSTIGMYGKVMFLRCLYTMTLIRYCNNYSVFI